MLHIISLLVNLLIDGQVSKLFFHLHNINTAFLKQNGRKIMDTSRQ